MESLSQKYSRLATIKGRRIMELNIAIRLMYLPIFIMLILFLISLIFKDYEYIIVYIIMSSFAICYSLAFYLGIIKKREPIHLNSNEKSAIKTYDAYMAVDRAIKSKSSKNLENAIRGLNLLANSISNWISPMAPSDMASTVSKLSHAIQNTTYTIENGQSQDLEKVKDLLYSLLESQDRGLHADELDEYTSRFNSLPRAQRIFEDRNRGNRIVSVLRVQILEPRKYLKKSNGICYPVYHYSNRYCIYRVCYLSIVL